MELLDVVDKIMNQIIQAGFLADHMDAGDEEDLFNMIYEEFKNHVDSLGDTK